MQSFLMIDYFIGKKRKPLINKLEQSTKDIFNTIADFVPFERLNGENWVKYYKERPFIWIEYLANTLYDFYTRCENDASLYNEIDFFAALSEHTFLVPQHSPVFGTDFQGNKTKRVQYFLRNEEGYEEENQIDIILAIAYELIDNKITLKRCKECKKWFVAYKGDKEYCDACSNERRAVSQKIDTLYSGIENRTIKELNKFKKQAENAEYEEKDRKQKFYLKYDAILTDFRKAFGNDRIKAENIPLSELIEYHAKLKKFSSDNFPKAKEVE